MGRRPISRPFAAVVAAVLCSAAIISFMAARSIDRIRESSNLFHPASSSAPFVSPDSLSPFQRTLLHDLDRQTHASIRYRDGYFAGGDPPPAIGVCTDVIVRAMRAAGVDLHRGVAADIRSVRGAYRVTRPDPNIDHRRCRNLVVYFRRHARELPISGPNADWQPGDIVFWDTRHIGTADHVGMVANGRTAENEPTVVHHWPGNYVAETDGLTRIRVRYHFRWKGA